MQLNKVSNRSQSKRKKILACLGNLDRGEIKGFSINRLNEEQSQRNRTSRIKSRWPAVRRIVHHDERHMGQDIVVNFARARARARKFIHWRNWRSI